MCWISNIAELKVAKEDIKIFKLCLSMRHLLSYYNGFAYELNKVYELGTDIVPIFSPYRDGYEISIGFHSYANNCQLLDRRWHYIVTSPDNRARDCYSREDLVLVRGYIPKGSHYYLNDYGEYVSDKICLTSIEKIQCVG